MVNIYFIGSAGSGKTTLTYAFQLWLNQQGLDCITVNLDPGAERIPYTCEVDVRDWIDTSRVMDIYNVGPNGAQIICADLIATKANEIKEAIEEYPVDYVLIDTPGQMELFTLRESGKIIIDVLGRENSLVAFLYDPVISKTPSGFVSMLFLSASTYFRLGLPQINILSKVDLLSEEELEKIISWSNDPFTLYDDLSMENKQIDVEIFRVLESMEIYRNVTPVSAQENFGMEDLYNAVQQIFYAGEDLSSD